MSAVSFISSLGVRQSTSCFKSMQRITRLRCHSEVSCSMWIDKREKLLLQHLEQKPFVESVQLDIGDVHYRLNEQLVYIVERKRIDDLTASISDGRWREQKARLRQCMNNGTSIIYLIEGVLPITRSDLNDGPSRSVFGISLNSFMSAQTNTIVRDRMQIYRTNSVTESVLFLLNMRRKIEEHYLPDGGPDFVKNVHYLDAVHLCKKDNIDKFNCNVLQLAQIPGVSIQMARQIISTYQSLKHLYAAYDGAEDDKQRELLLQDLKYLPAETGPGRKKRANVKTRRIGKAASKTIYRYLN